MKKPSELIEEATKAGCETITDYVEWAYNTGRKDTYDEVTKDIEDNLEFLREDFKPTSVTYHTNKDKS